jgi:hypothetical protein
LLFGAQWVMSGHLVRVLCLGAITASLTYFDRSVLPMVSRARAELGVTAAAMVSHLSVLAATALFGLPRRRGQSASRPVSVLAGSPSSPSGEGCCQPRSAKGRERGGQRPRRHP